MFVLPLFVRTLPQSNFVQAWLFLERNGSHLIEVVDECSAIAFAEENDLKLSETIPPFVKDTLVFLPIDHHKTVLTDFYTWVEVPPGTQPPKEVWRPFLWSLDDLALNKYLSEISLADDPSINIFSVLQNHFNRTL